MEKIIPGIYPELQDSEYRSGGGLSSTLLRLFLQAPAKAHYQQIKPPSDTISNVFLMGILCHAIVLEPDTVSRRFAVMPEDLDRRTKKGKDTYSAFLDEVGSDGYVITHEMMQHAIGVQESVMNHPRASRYFAYGETELSVFSQDVITGLLLCCRVDWMCGYPNVVVDLKTCANASAESFNREAIKYGYHLQAVHYLETCRLAGIEKEDFLFVAVEKEPPYLCQMYRLSDVLKNWSMDVWRAGVNQFAECQSSGQWPGYGNDVVDIELPKWVA